MSAPTSYRLRRRAVLAGAAAAIATPAYAQFDVLKKLGDGLTRSAAPAPAPQALKGGLQDLQPRGYSQRFLPVRDMIRADRYDDALNLFQPADARAKSTAIVSDPFLMNVEAGLLELEKGGPDRALNRFRAAEDSVTAQDAKDGASAGGSLSSAFDWVAGKATGQEELEAYHALDHERILQLNYMTLSFLLQGDRRCYNVTRGCIEEQGQLKSKFDKEIADYKAKYDKQMADGKLSGDDRQAAAGLSDQFKSYDQIAGRVPNAYVNPLADYLAAVIQEVVSSEQPALRDNSRIAYLDAATLCGGSPQLLTASKAMARPRVPKDERVLHVIVGEGFAPAREVMTYGFAMGGQIVPVRVPVFTPVPSNVSRIVVRAAKGTVLAECDPIGDFEAIRLRDQHDRQPEIMLSVVSSMLASYGADQATRKMGLLGSITRTARDANASPDTRSWLSLPRRFHAARITLPAGIKSVELVAYDNARRESSVKVVDMADANSQSLIYARATDAGLAAQAARRLWIDGRLEDAAK